jgi:hypothetical protein
MYLLRYADNRANPLHCSAPTLIMIMIMLAMARQDDFGNIQNKVKCGKLRVDIVPLVMPNRTSFRQPFLYFFSK